MSAEYDLAFLDEATELVVDDWEAVHTRLRNGVLPWSQQIGALNPSQPQHWIKQRADNEGMPMLHSRHVDNPALYDDSGAVGRRYRRQDEIGTPFCITVDHQTAQDNTVTLRERDSMKQERVSSDQILGYVMNKLSATFG